MSNIAPKFSIQRFKQHANDIRNDIRYGYRRLRARPSLAPLTGCDRRIVESLKRTGAYVTNLEEMCIGDSEAILAAGDLVTSNLSRLPVAEGKFTVSANADEIEEQRNLILWGLDERLLGIVSRYIGMDIAYRGLTVRRDIVGGPRNETRMWHRDNEDNRIVKIIVYLNALDDGDGPFEFIPRNLTPASWRVPIVDSSRVSDNEMSRLVPESEWRTCTGPRGTVVFVDTCGVFHRGRVARRQDRRTLFYCYNSQRPLNPQWCGPLFDGARLEATIPDLTETQRESIRFAY